jgi:DinB family protein
MTTTAQRAVSVLGAARRTLDGSINGLALADALDAAGGVRSVLGVLKHAAGWSHVYHCYAFETPPRHWNAIDWPRGLRDTIDVSQEYVDEMVAWLRVSQDRWLASVGDLEDDAFDAPRPCHWGGAMPLFGIVLMVADHWSYHAGEINALLSIRRGHAWEYTEEVEENHISTAGHRLRPGWMSDEHAAKYEAFLAQRDEELHGSRS